VAERNGAAYLGDSDTLAGSTLTMERAVRTMAGLVGLPRALTMATETPARVAGLDSFAAAGVGGRADLVALDATTGAVTAAWIAGEQVLGGARA
jgi:N-acetylglucosamine-6-phosphate deacetylase